MGNRITLIRCTLLVSAMLSGTSAANSLLPDMHSSTTLKSPKKLSTTTLSEAIKHAIEWHPRVTSASAQLEQQGQIVQIARSAYLPQIRTGIKTNYSDSEGRSEESITISGSQLIYDFGKTASNVEAAELGSEKYYAESLITMDQLAKETAFAVLEVERYQQLVKIANEQVAGVTNLLNLSAKRSELGASARSDEMQALSRRESALATELQLASQLDMWKRTLQSLVGSSIPPTVTPSNLSFLTQACRKNTSTLTDIPEIMAAEARRAEALATIKSSKADFFPTITMEAGAEHYLKERARNYNKNRDRNDYTIGLNFNIDLYQGGATTARKRNAEYALRSAEADKDEIMLNVYQELQESAIKVDSHEQRSGILQSRIENIVATQEIYRQQYIALGTRTLLDLLNTEQEIHQARMEFVNNKQDLQQLNINCLYNTGSIRKTFSIASK